MIRLIDAPLRSFVVFIALLGAGPTVAIAQPRDCEFGRPYAAACLKLSQFAKPQAGDPAATAPATRAGQ